MSELKEHQFCESDEFFREYPGPLSNELHLYYLKSEADKVIAELKADYQEACDRLQTANLIKDEQLAETRRQKYKRCLSMAEMCEAECYYFNEREEHIGLTTYERRRWELFSRWRLKWAKLAEKFKEAK